MKLFENGVGRPSNETLRKRRMFYGGVIGCIAILLFVGVVTFSNIGSNEIVGSLKKSSGNNTLEIKNVATNSFDYYWKSTKGLGIQSFTTYNSSPNCQLGSKIGSKHTPVKNKKSGSWRVGNGGTEAGKIFAGNWYVASAKFHDGKVINVCFQTKKGKDETNSLEVKNITNYSFDIYWKSAKGIESFSVYESNSASKRGVTIFQTYPSAKYEKDSSWRIGDGGSEAGKIKPNKYYLVSAKFDDGKIINRLILTKNTANSMEVKNITNESFDVYWKSQKGVRSFSVYKSNSSGARGDTITQNYPQKQEKSGSWRVGKGGSAAGKIKQNNYYLVSVQYDDGQVLNKTVLVKKTTTTATSVALNITASRINSFVVSSHSKNCYKVTAPTNAKYWRIAVYYKKAGIGSYGNNKYLTRNHYNDGVKSEVVCFKKQKYASENHRLMLKWTTGSNDKVSGKPSDWKPSGFKVNNSIGWTYKDYTIK